MTRSGWSTGKVVVKAEVVVLPGREPRDNPRCVITNLPASPKRIYRDYAARGDMENRIQERHDGLRFDLTRCSAFSANPFRNLVTAAAHVLFQPLRRLAAGTACAAAQVGTLRERLLKVPVAVRESVRRIALEGPAAYVWFSAWRRVAFRLGASP